MQPRDGGRLKVTVVGAGPAGLCAARILAQLGHDVAVLERRRRDDAPGLGITLPAPALEVITLGDPAPALELTPPWQTAEIAVNGETFAFPFEPLVGVARAALVSYLVRRCEEAGATVAFGHDVADVARLAGACDLLIGADGVHSVVRAAFEFGAQVTDGDNWFAWLGATGGPARMRLAFEQTPHGMLLAAFYPYAPERCTVIVECSPAARRGLGLDPLDLDALGARLGVRLDTPGPWRRFRTVRTARLVHGSVALVGDAGASMYYALGAGTMMAVEGAAALATLVHTMPLADGLAAYEHDRRPHLRAVQLASDTDLHAMARLDALPPVDPAAFARAYVARFTPSGST